MHFICRLFHDPLERAPEEAPERTGKEQQPRQLPGVGASPLVVGLGNWRLHFGLLS